MCSTAADMSQSGSARLLRPPPFLTALHSPPVHACSGASIRAAIDSNRSSDRDLDLKMQSVRSPRLRPSRCPGAHVRFNPTRTATMTRATSSPSYGLFVCSGSPEISEALGAAAPDWLCLDAQHGAVPYDILKFMLCAAGSKSKKIVRVGGPTDRFGIQQALE